MNERIRVLYSFPHKLGAGRICHTAWQQVNGLASAGAEVIAHPGVLHRPVSENVEVRSTLAWGRVRISYKLMGMTRACTLHDRIVARRIEREQEEIDIVHTWPLGSRRTIEAAHRRGIPTVLERPNAHTRFAYEVVQRECDRLGVPLPADHEHAFKADVLQIEEEEYGLTDYLLCPSEFVARTFLDRGFPREKLLRHIYGFDETVYHPGAPRVGDRRRSLTMLFAGVCAVRKGLHYALEAWLASPAHLTGTFLIAGDFLPAYREKLAPMLAHPSVKVLGHRDDVPDLMRESNVLVLPSIEEGSALVCAEAMGSGCVPLVSDASSGHCRHNENSLVHRVGDVDTLTAHITSIHEDRALLHKLRESGLGLAKEITWTAAGRRLLDVYQAVLGRAKF
jgi:glycosyltransferase involved in cell wall biosynthesis